MVSSFGRITTVLTCLSTITSAVPIAQPGNGFTLNQVSKRTTQGRKINLPGMYAGAYSKFGAIVPQSIKDAADNGTALAKPEGDDKEYLTPVRVGDTILNLDIDTGSADLWVFSSELPASQRTEHSVYKPGGNGTKMEGSSWKISYGDGSAASGDVYKDTVSVGGVTAYDQAIEAAQQVSQQFTKDVNSDGLLGLAFSHINTVEPQPEKTFFDTVKSSLDSPVFAVALKHHASGSYDFGYIDKSKHTGSITYTPVDNSDGYWMFTAAGYSIGNSQTNPNPIRGIADTGTTLLMLPKELVTEYYQQIPGSQDNPSAGGFVVPCNAELPDFTVEITSGTGVSASASIPGIALPSPTVGFGGGIGGGSGGSGGGAGIGINGGILGGSLGGSSGSGGIIGGNSGGGGILGGSLIGRDTSKNTNSKRDNQPQGTYKAVTPGKYIKMFTVGDDESACFGGIQSSDGMEFSIFGDVFLKNQYVVFDTEGPRLGFAPQAG